MPKLLEKKLKKQYGEHSDIPYKIMNKMKKKHKKDMGGLKGTLHEKGSWM